MFVVAGNEIRQFAATVGDLIMVDTVKELLADPWKGSKRNPTVLSFLFRDVLIYTKMNLVSWERHMRNYEKKPHNRNKVDVGNLNKALIKDHFMWPVFKKAIDFLNPVSATLTVELEWFNGRSSAYRLVIDPAEDETDVVDVPDEETVSEIFKDRPLALNSLARLYRTIINNEQITNLKWDALLKAQATNPNNGVPQTNKGISNFISTRNKELLSPRITWNVFTKGLLLLKPKEVTFILTMKWDKAGKNISVHHIALPNVSELDTPPTTPKGSS